MESSCNLGFFIFLICLKLGICGECSPKENCVVPIQCPAHVLEPVKVECDLGICCSTGQNHSDPVNSKLREKHDVVKIDPPTMDLITTRSRMAMNVLSMREQNIAASHPRPFLRVGSPSYGHFRNMRVYGMSELAEVMQVASRALEIALATKEFKDRRGLDNRQIEYDMIEEEPGPYSGRTCGPTPACPGRGERFRRIDGACNNLKFPSWGMPLTPYARLLPPSYGDGIWSPRVSRNGKHLPSARWISSVIFEEEDFPSLNYTLMVMQFGQFLSHDITQSIDASFQNGSAISCCTPDGRSSLRLDQRHYACMPIIIPKDDPFYSNFKQGCMNFVRSVLAPEHDCKLGYAQQMNKITHYLDGSSIYGSTPEQTRELRTFHGGRLRVFEDFGRELLPLSREEDACLTMEQGSACFTSGDTRTNQMVSLVVIHTIFMREHNRIAKILQRLNPYWNDETVFLEARRIVAAELQVITYKEFLPAVLGDATARRFSLVPSDGAHRNDYDENVRPSVTNEFASAAFRLHSSVDGSLKIYGTRKMEEIIDIPEVMFYPARMRKREFLDEMLNTLTTEPMQDVDGFLPDALTKYMFRAGNPFGVDIASLNIQRGRDHGLRPYNDYRELIGEKRFEDFREFGRYSEKLRRLYSSVDDVDLWVGGLLEPKETGSVLGVTFRNIIADQFSRLKRGDRYFFEYDSKVNPGFFTPEQVVELKKASMSRIICDNRDGILLAKQALNAFKAPGINGNDLYDCSGRDIPRVNLNLWRSL